MEEVEKEEEGNDINQVRKRSKGTCGQKVVSATQSHSRLEWIYPSNSVAPSNDSEEATLAVGTAPPQVQEFNFAIQQGEVIAGNSPAVSDVATTIDSWGYDFQFNIQDSQSIIYTQQDDETTRLAPFHIVDTTVAATSGIGPIHLNPYTIANVADQAQPPVPQPTATIGVDLAAATNKTATVGTAPPQVQEFNFDIQPGEVIAGNNPAASDVAVTIDRAITDGAMNDATALSQSSWEVELDALLSSTSGTAGPSTTSAEPATSVNESSAIAKLQELLSFSASMILECNGLDSVGECLKELAFGGLLSNENVVRLYSLLYRTREYFSIFQRALRAEDDLKAAMAAQEAIRPKVEVIRAKKKELADLDCQIAELQNRRSAVASELAKGFESSKTYLTEYAAGAKRVEQLKMDKRAQQA